jgi:hypothetical protein
MLSAVKHLGSSALLQKNPWGIFEIASREQNEVKEEQTMADNRGVAYMGRGTVEVQSIDFPKFVGPGGRKCDHGVILKLVATNICGSDPHMIRGRTTAPVGMVMGHEITGEVIERARRRIRQERRLGLSAV